MSWLFSKRSFKGKRWIGILLRSFHLMGIAGLAGAYLYALPEQQWYRYLLITFVSGALMICKEIYSDGIWLLQLRGQIILLKVFSLLAVWIFWAEHDPYLYLGIIFISGIIAHAPGNVRYYSVVHRRVLTRDNWDKKLAVVKDCGEY